MSVAIRAITRVQDADDMPALGAGQDGYAPTWDNATGAFVMAALSGSGLAADGSVAGATSQAQAFTVGVTVGTRPASSDDSALIIARAVGDTINSHGIRDESLLTAGSAATGYATIDVAYSAGGTANYNHLAAYQARMLYNGSGTVGTMRGYQSSPSMSGPVTNVLHYEVVDANVLVGGTLTNQYGLFVNALTEAANNYAIYTMPSTPSFFGGKVRVGITLDEDGDQTSDGHLAVTPISGGNRLMIGWNNTSFFGWLQAARYDAAVYASLLLNPKGGNVGIGLLAPAARLHVDQPSTTGAIPVLTVDQADVSEEFIRFIGTSTTDATQSLVDAANMTTPGALVGWLKIYVQDDQATNPITDGAYYVPFYSAPTA